MGDDLDPLDDSGAFGGRVPFGSPRLARLVQSPAARRLSPRRLVLALGLGTTLAWGLLELGTRSAAGLTNWVAGQPEHRIPFESIELVPPPPPFIRDGAPGILAAVRDEARYDAGLSVVATDLDELRTALSLNPWIEGVAAVRASYRRVSAEVTYRQPLALMVFEVAGKRDQAVLVDRNAVEMLHDEAVFRWARMQPYRPEGAARLLIEIRGFGAGEGDRTGKTFKPADPKFPENKVLEAARIADFLARHADQMTPKGHAYPNFWKIEYTGIPESARPRSGFFLVDDRKNLIMWDSGPEHEARGEPRAGEKWQMLGRFIDERGKLDLGNTEANYLRFGNDGVEVRPRPPARRG